MAIKEIIQGRKDMRSVIMFLLIFVLLSSSAAQAVEKENIVYSVLFPGWGQMKEGRYTRGTILMGAEIIALAGVLASNIQYDRDVDQYESARAMFESATYIGDAEFYHERMVEKWDDADQVDRYRKTLLGVAVGVWSLGLIDMIWGGEPEEIPISMEIKENGFLLTKSFSF